MDLVTQEKSQKVVVPNLFERRLPEAKEILARSSLKVGTISPADAPDAGFVTKQSPAAGAKVDQGTSVHLEVKPPSADPARDLIRRMAEQPDFEAVSASEAKLARILEKEGIRARLIFSRSPKRRTPPFVIASNCAT